MSGTSRTEAGNADSVIAQWSISISIRERMWAIRPYSVSLALS